jgi:predicted nucleic acid-binding protein
MTVNAGEVWYLLRGPRRQMQRQLSDLAAGSCWAGLGPHRKLPLKSKHRMSFADCFAAALAKQRKATLLTGDLEFRQVQEQVRIQWLE